LRRLLSEGFKETCEGFRQKREFASYFFAKKKKKTYDVLRRYIKKKGEPCNFIAKSRPANMTTMIKEKKEIN
jgi:hypothetical protein